MLFVLNILLSFPKYIKKERIYIIFNFTYSFIINFRNISQIKKIFLAVANLNYALNVKICIKRNWMAESEKLKTYVDSTGTHF